VEQKNPRLTFWTLARRFSKTGTSSLALVS
jgi:hypothetical protein